MIDMSFERPESQFSPASSKILKMLRLLSFRLSLICAKITQPSKLNYFVIHEDFLLKIGFQRALTYIYHEMIAKSQFFYSV